MSSSPKPLVSIGLPVFNGERFLARTMDSLLDQSLRDFELIISDNASTDGTREICEQYARGDARVRYIHQPVNIGAPRNWNVVANEARGEFFKWASASDVCVPRVLERCVGVLQQDPTIVLCYGRTQWMDEEGRPLSLCEGDVDVCDELASDRFFRVCTELIANNAQCGVVRLDVLRQTGYDRLYPSGDMALTAELALYGKLRLLPDVFAFRRRSRETFTSMLTPLERQRVYDPKARAPMKLIQTRRCIDNFASISRAPLPASERLRAYRDATRLAWWDRKILGREVLSLMGFPAHPSALKI